MTNTIDRYAFEEAIQDITDEDSIREDYSGRGMYGRTCIGITVSPSVVGQVSGALVAEAARLREQVEEDGGEEGAGDWADEQEAIADALEAMAGSISWDNMGLDMIVYFPGWEFS